MLEGMPWPAQIGIMSGGYVGFVTVCLWVVRGYINGNTFPRRTVEELERRNHADAKTIAELTDTVATLEKGAELANALMENLNNAVIDAKSEVSDR